MPKTNLKRMNRFELLELMYRIVTENERLAKRCEELERQLSYAPGDNNYRSPGESPRNGYGYEPRTVSRREEILARVDEQSSVPRTRREAPLRQSDGALRRKAGSVGESEAPGRTAVPAAQTQQRPAAQPEAPAARPAPRTRSAPVRSAPMPPNDDFDIDSILEDYFSDLPFDAKGRDA